ncbi:MAG: polysaccharide biosynthesis/export family protein [Longimicrobiales bacterium]|nr:polysaccharide biosynthesis/export family protein [Longimicrobiales bacterium]
MRKSVLFLTAVTLVLTPSWAQAQQQPVTPAQPQYLRPGDVVRLRIWREPDMSGEYIVDEAGMVIFPRVGEYRVLDDTPESLTARLLADYLQYLVNPSIEITVLRRVRIVGAVMNPGLHMVDPTITVADALAKAGGPSINADQDKIRIIRDGVEIAVDVRVDTRIADSPLRSGDQIYVPLRGWVSRNAGLVAATMSAVVSLTIALFIR